VALFFQHVRRARLRRQAPPCLPAPRFCSARATLRPTDAASDCQGDPGRRHRAPSHRAWGRQPSGTTPANPIGGFGFGGVTGYFVYAADAGTVTLPGPSEENTPAGDSFLYTLNQGLPVDSYIVAFQNQGTATAPDWQATALSGAIIDTGAPPPTPIPEPSTWAMMALGFAGLGFAAFRRSRKDSVSILG
jgi:PEP-CTERM motif